MKIETYPANRNAILKINNYAEFKRWFSEPVLKGSFLRINGFILLPQYLSTAYLDMILVRGKSCKPFTMNTTMYVRLLNTGVIEFAK